MKGEFACCALHINTPNRQYFVSTGINVHSLTQKNKQVHNCAHAVIVSTTFLRANPAVAPKTGPLFFIWVLPLLLGAQNFCFHSNSTAQMKAPRSKLADNDMGTHSSLGQTFLPHPPRRG